MTFVCVLKTGGQYTAAHVERLRAMLWKPVVCLTDDPSVTEPTIPLRHGWPGWWSKLELFEHDFGHAVYFDLDVTVQSLAWLDGLKRDADAFYAMADAYQPNGCPLNSSVMAWSGPRPDLISGFNPAIHAEHVGGDQDWIWRNLGGQFTLLRPPAVVSFKKHGKLPEAGVVVYHGKPKPWEVACTPEGKASISELFPNSTTAKSEQYRIAWDALLNTPDQYSAEARSHAKVWMTYRAVDGDVKLKDWKEKVAGAEVGHIEPAKLRARWQTSQEVAEIYLAVLNSDPFAVTRARAFIDGIGPALALWPASATSVARVGAIAAYWHLARGDKETAIEYVTKTVNAWMSSWANLDYSRNPLRFAELPSDAAPMHALMRILAVAGRATSVTHAWAEGQLVRESKTPWWRCMEKVGKYEGAIW